MDNKTTRHCKAVQSVLNDLTDALEEVGGICCEMIDSGDARVCRFKDYIEKIDTGIKLLYEIVESE